MTHEAARRTNFAVIHACDTYELIIKRAITRIDKFPLSKKWIHWIKGLQIETNTRENILY